MENTKQLMQGEDRLRAEGRESMKQWLQSGKKISEYPTGYGKPFGELTSKEREVLASEHQKLADKYEQRAAYHNEQSTEIGRGRGPLRTLE